MSKRTDSYLKIVYWSEEDQCYIGIAPELKGCSGLGGTPEQALKEAKISIEQWIRVAKKEGMQLPEPVGAKHSQRLNLRLPEEVVDQVSAIIC